MNLSTLREQRRRLLVEARAFVPADSKTQMSAASQTQFDNIMEKVDSLRKDIERIERSEAMEARSAEDRSTGRPPRSQPGIDIDSTPERTAEKRAFVDYLKTGTIDRSALREQRDLSTGNTGVLIAQDFLPQLIEAKKAWGQLTVAVNQKRTANGEPLKIASVDDTAQVSTVIGESTTNSPVTVTEEDPNFSGFINNVDFLSTGVIKISIADLQDSYFNLDEWIRDAFGKRIARGLSKLIVTGSQSGNFQSIISTAAAGVTSAETSTLDYADFVAMYAKLDPAYLGDACWVMNSTSRSLLLGKTDTLGRPLFVPSVNTDSLDRILNLPVVISQAHPPVSAGAVGAVQLGSLKDAYTLRTAGDISVLRLNERYADTGQVAFIGYHRNSGYATPVGSPLINLTQHA